MGLDPKTLSNGVLRAMHRETTLRESTSQNWPGGSSGDKFGYCRSCGVRYIGPSEDANNGCCYRCALQGRPPKTSTGDGVGNADIIDAWLPCIPPTRTAQQKGAFIQRGKGEQKPRIRFFTKKTVKEASNEFRRILGPIAPQEPLSGALSFHVEFVFPWPKSTPKKKQVDREPMANKVDCDNLSKGICDVMTAMGFWLDDSQIYDLRVRKFRGNEPGISIKIGR